jgi:hypothetical protein
LSNIPSIFGIAHNSCQLREIKTGVTPAEAGVQENLWLPSLLGVAPIKQKYPIMNNQCPTANLIIGHWILIIGYLIWWDNIKLFLLTI